MPWELLESSASASTAETYGFLLKLDQARAGRPELARELLERLVASDWKLVYLRRENVLRQAISFLVVQERRGKWHDRASEPDSGFRVRIDPETLQMRVRGFEVSNVLYDGLLEALPALRLSYEDDLLRGDLHQATADRVFEYLGLPPAPIATRLRRSTADRLEQFVENYDEVVETIRAGKYARFL